MKEMSFFLRPFTHFWMTPLALPFLYKKIETVYLYHTFQARVFLQAFYSRFLGQGSKSLIHIESRSLKVLITGSMKS
jgi:hypothetical protein